jgi:putative FmdB family regulatory protein
MPIYEYSCQECDNDFEELVRGEEVPVCPSCGTGNIGRRMSLPRVHSQSTKALSMKAAKKRDAGQAKDRMHDRLHYEESHDRHG